MIVGGIEYRNDLTEEEIRRLHSSRILEKWTQALGRIEDFAIGMAKGYASEFSTKVASSIDGRVTEEEFGVYEIKIYADHTLARIAERGSGIYGPYNRPIRPKSAPLLIWNLRTPRPARTPKGKPRKTGAAPEVKGVPGVHFIERTLESEELKQKILEEVRGMLREIVFS